MIKCAQPQPGKALPKGLALILTLTSIATSAQELPRYSLERFPQSTDTAPGMKTVRIAKQASMVRYSHDVVYTSRDGIDLHLQIIQPEASLEGPLPCIVYVQGSAWRKQNVYANLPQLTAFAKRGFTIAVVEYRPTEVAMFPAQVQDAKTAIRFMRKHAKKYGVDTNNVFIWGDSSGGHTSLMVALTGDKDELDTPNLGEYGISVNAVVDFYGPTDISQMSSRPSNLDHDAATSPEGMLIGGKNVHENPALTAPTNPVNYLSKEHADLPFLIMHGSKDRTVPFHQSALLAKALQEHGYPYSFYRLEGADHGSPEFWSAQSFDLVEDFLRKHLK